MITPEAQAKGAQALRDIADARARLILKMVADGESHAFIAYAFNMHESSVRTAIHRARKRLGVPARPRMES
jgi:DNA-binding NarL/FixJ family response regulator